MFRTKKVIRCARVCLTWLTVCLLAFDVGSACHILHGGSGSCSCQLTTGTLNWCDTGYVTTTLAPGACAPAYRSTHVHSSRGSCHDCTVAGCDGICGDLSSNCGGGGVVVSECGDGGVVEYGDDGTESNQRGTGNAVVDNVAPIDDDTPPRPMNDDAPVPLDLEGENVAPMPTTDDDLEPSLPMDDLEPEITDDGSLNGLFNDAPDTSPPPAETAPAPRDSGLDDLFNDDTSPDPAANDANLDDLFNDDVSETTEAESTPAADDSNFDDLFDETTDTPSDTTPDVDDSGLDDLFDDTGDDTVPADGDDFFNEIDDVPAPADTSSPNDADASLDDLFNDAARDAVPADTSPDAGDDMGDDLFNDAADDAEPADTSAPTDDSDFDDLFDDSGTNGTGSDDLDDLFSSKRPTPTRQISFVANEDSQPLRAWLDDTGRYRTVGRLILIGEDHIRLRKPNGRVCTVPYQRLSDEDVDYVRQQVRQHRAALKVATRAPAN